MLPVSTNEIDQGKCRGHILRPPDPHIRLYPQVLFGHEIRLRLPFVRAMNVEEGEGGTLGKSWRIFILQRHKVNQSSFR